MLECRCEMPEQTRRASGLDAEAKPPSESAGEEPSIQKPILVTGGSVHIRKAFLS